MADLPDPVHTAPAEMREIASSARSITVLRHYLRDAADEIESLRARLAQAEAQRDTAWLATSELHDLADRQEAALATARRDALNEAAEYFDTHHGDELAFHWDKDISAYLRMLARAALVVADTGEGLSKTSAKPLVVADTQPSIDKAKCCDLHGRNCEPPSELCCDQCTEAHHGIHGDPPNFDTVSSHHDGSVCSNPDLSGFGVADTPEQEQR